MKAPVMIAFAPNIDGGAAFPCETYGFRNGKETTTPTNGMSLRDWFAGQALIGIMSNYTTTKFGATDADVARAAYDYADAMLASRRGGAK